MEYFTMFFSVAFLFSEIPDVILSYHFMLHQIAAESVAAFGSRACMRLCCACAVSEGSVAREVPFKCPSMCHCQCPVKCPSKCPLK